MILGLDISTSITGITLIDYNNNTILNDAIDLRKYKNFFIKSEKVAEYFKKLSQKPDIIFIEQSLQSLAGFKITKGTPAKKQVLQYLVDNEPSFMIEYTRHGNPKPDTYDRADSLIIARAGLQLCMNKKN